MSDRYYLNERQGLIMDDGKYKTAAVILGILAVLFAIAFIVMLLLFLFAETEDFVVPTIFTYDADGAEWSDKESLSVFYNEEFGSEKVAPYSSGSYEFQFENASDYTLKYSIVLTEDNEYGVALTYRIKRDGQYVDLGEGQENSEDYVRVSEFSCTELTVVSGSRQSFELEWYWDGDANDAADTLAGLTESIYTLTITISATVV